jgi:Ser/Thr protein kinase RdoA (MazF antagonist)
MHTAGRGQRYTRPPLYTIKTKDNTLQLEAYNLLLKGFREQYPISYHSIEEIPGLLAAAHLETITAVK